MSQHELHGATKPSPRSRHQILRAEIESTLDEQTRKIMAERAMHNADKKRRMKTTDGLDTKERRLQVISPLMTLIVRPSDLCIGIKLSSQIPSLHPGADA